MRGLYLTDAEGRNHDGSYRYPSRFIFDIDKPLLTYTAELDQRLVREARQAVESGDRLLALAAEGPEFLPGTA